MKVGNFDTLPQLSKNNALEILETPLEQLKLSSDYYKAVFHLSKYPSKETEAALIDLIKSNSLEQPVLIAKRKAIEVLGRMGCKNAIPYIGENLNSNDPYIVENSALALQEIGCNEIKFLNLIGDLLEQPNQNKRVLIQCLGRMGAVSELSKIQKIFNQKGIPSSIKGASIAAISSLTGDQKNIELLADFLNSPNQNDRICAIQDIIDAKAYKLISLVLATPISPFFRIHTITSLLTNIYNKEINRSIINSLDSIVLDDPNNLRLLGIYPEETKCNFLFNELFSPDFNRAYYALRKLKTIDSRLIWIEIKTCWERFKKDYGALYFLVILLRYLEINTEQERKVSNEIINYCLDNAWPDYMKFKPQAIFSSIYIDLTFVNENIQIWLDNTKTKYWFSRYAALMAIENLIISNRISENHKNLLVDIDETNQFVKIKLDYIVSKYLLI